MEGVHSGERLYMVSTEQLWLAVAAVVLGNTPCKDFHGEKESIQSLSVRREFQDNKKEINVYK